jgi:AcrR family transcriptional regulator
VSLVTAPISLQERRRNAARNEIADIALDLFMERGFDEVTVDDISLAVGISARSFHRYFAAKEDVVLGGLNAFGHVVSNAFTLRPSNESTWTSLLRSYEALLARAETHDERRKRRMQVVNAGAASLRARNLEKHLRWGELLTPLVIKRLKGPDIEVRARAIVHASLIAFDLALATWANPNETRAPEEILALTFNELEKL